MKANCPMHLEKFPMDTQTCPLVIGSRACFEKYIEYSVHAILIKIAQVTCFVCVLSVDGYDINYVQYRWTYGPNASIKMAPDMTLSQFDLIDFPQGAENRSLPMGGKCETVFYFPR